MSVWIPRIDACISGLLLPELKLASQLIAVVRRRAHQKLTSSPRSLAAPMLAAHAAGSQVL